VNIPGNGSSTAGSIEYRRGLWRYVEWTAGALYEGRSNLIDRYGLTTQIWLAEPFFDDRLALGAGVGFYFAEDRRREQRSSVFLSEIVSITASYRLSAHWLVRGTWDRIITDYDRDSDIFWAVSVTGFNACLPDLRAPAPPFNVSLNMLRFHQILWPNESVHTSRCSFLLI
jgi:hypothetical protein